jgi:hypothetical protein
VVIIALVALLVSAFGLIAQLRKRDTLSARLAKALDSDDFPVAAEEATFRNYVDLISWSFILLASMAALFLQFLRP